MIRPLMIRSILPAAAAALALLAGPAEARPVGCALPLHYLEEARPLQASARALELGRMRVLVVGSASVAGTSLPDPAGAWPARLQALLAERYPASGITVSVRGGRGASVTDNLPRLVEGLRAETPSLVIWQAGTVELSRGMDPGEMSEVMREGLEAIRRAGAEAIVMDQQYSRFLRANANIEPYRDQLRLIAAGNGAALFPRYALMQHWVETGALDLERVPRADRVAALDRLNDCMAAAVARLVIQGLREAR